MFESTKPYEKCSYIPTGIHVKDRAQRYFRVESCLKRIIDLRVPCANGYHVSVLATAKHNESPKCRGMI